MTLGPFLEVFFLMKNHKKHSEVISKYTIKPSGFSDFYFSLNCYCGFNVHHSVLIPDCSRISHWNNYTFVPGSYSASLIIPVSKEGQKSRKSQTSHHAREDSYMTSFIVSMDLLKKWQSLEWKNHSIVNQGSEIYISK